MVWKNKNLLLELVTIIGLKKKISQLLSLIAFIILFYGSTFAQSSYSKATLKELKTLQEDVTKALSDNDSLSIARAYYKLALKYDYIDQNDSCALYYNNALAIAKKIKNIRAIAIISNAKATTYSDRGFHEEAIKIYNEVTELFFSEKDTTGAAGVKLNCGAEYVEMGEYQKGLELSLEALSLKLVTSDSINIAGFYHQIGSIFKIVGNNQKWGEYILLANSIAKKNEKYGDFYRRMDLLNELGGYYFSKNNFELAKKYYDTLYVQSSNGDYLAGITAATSNLVPLLKKENKFNEALALSKKALSLALKSGRTYKIIYNLVETAKLEIILLQYYNAKKNILQAKKLSIKYNYPDALISVYEILSELNFANGNYKLAYSNLSKHYTLKDSIEGGKTKQVIAELETKYQTEKKDNQIKILNQENLIQEEHIAFQNKTVIGLILLGVLVISLFALFYTQTRLKSENRVLNMHQKLLRSQMDPHFIFNALIAIQSYILKNKRFEASDYLSQFATLMRSILGGSRNNFHSLKNEIEMLNNYISLQQLRFENSFLFHLEVDEKIDTEVLQIPPMLIQPFIENAIEHGLRKIVDDEKNLTVKYILEETSLIIFIEDNGIGIDKSKENKSDTNHKSFAIEITNERLMNITKIYKEKIDIVIQDLSVLKNKRGTQIKFVIPLRLLARNKND